MNNKLPRSIPSTSDQKYVCVLADPPWQHQGGEKHYPTMSFEALKAMPVKSLVAENAHLFLWTTNGTLRQGYELAEAWGFQVRSPLHWIKFRLGVGHYLRNASETLLFATRGTAPVRFRSQPTWMIAPVTSHHSEKPHEQYAVIDRIAPLGPRLELFARHHQPGFDVWGNEVESTITIPGYPIPSDKPHHNQGDPTCR